MFLIHQIIHFLGAGATKSIPVPYDDVEETVIRRPLHHVYHPMLMHDQLVRQHVEQFQTCAITLSRPKQLQCSLHGRIFTLECPYDLVRISPHVSLVGNDFLFPGYECSGHWFAFTEPLFKKIHRPFPVMSSSPRESTDQAKKCRVIKTDFVVEASDTPARHWPLFADLTLANRAKIVLHYEDVGCHAKWRSLHGGVIGCELPSGDYVCINAGGRPEDART